MTDKRVEPEKLYEKLGDSSGYKLSCDPMIPIIKDIGKRLRIIEIGISKGFGMWYMLENLDNIDKAYGIDPWIEYGNDSFEKCQSNMQIAMQVLYEHIGDKLNLIVGTSSKACHMFPDESIDYVFVDGDHSYKECKSDIELYWPKVKKGGVLAGHDYKNGENGVIKAVDEFEKKIESKVEKPGGWCWYVWKK